MKVKNKLTKETLDIPYPEFRKADCEQSAEEFCQKNIVLYGKIRRHV